jgi:monoamine oxidase
MNRREFLTLAAAASGSTYAAMQALDLLAQPARATNKFKLPVNCQNFEDKKIIILGAGLAGMCLVCVLPMN